MAIVYFDASAFVKLVIEEEGSDVAAALWDGCDAPVSSRLAYAEFAPRSPLPVASTGWMLMVSTELRRIGKNSGPRQER